MSCFGTRPAEYTVPRQPFCSRPPKKPFTVAPLSPPITNDLILNNPLRTPRSPNHHDLPTPPVSEPYPYRFLVQRRKHRSHRPKCRFQGPQGPARETFGSVQRFVCFASAFATFATHSIVAVICAARKGGCSGEGLGGRSYRWMCLCDITGVSKRRILFPECTV